jgi:hypothetical protein
VVVSGSDRVFAVNHLIRVTFEGKSCDRILHHSKEGDDNKAVDRVRSPFVACFRFQYREHHINTLSFSRTMHGDVLKPSRSFLCHLPPSRTRSRLWFHCRDDCLACLACRASLMSAIKKHEPLLKEPLTLFWKVDLDYRIHVLLYAAF